MKWISPDKRIRLWHGDCLEFLPRRKDGLADAFVTDPPYGMNFRSNMRKVTEKFDRLENDESPFTEWMPDAFRMTKLGGCLLCFYRWDVQEGFMVAIKAVGYDMRSQAVWWKPGGSMGDLKMAFAAEHELIAFATKGEYRFPSGRPMSVFKTAKVTPGQMIHPTEKPVGLLRQLLQAVVPEGGLVVDPCMGSGTTAAACFQLGMRFIGVEKDETHFRSAVARMEEEMTRTSSQLGEKG